MPDELPWLGLTEAAAVTGLAREAVRARARRGLIPSRKGNDGRVVVQVPAGLSAEAGPAEAELLAEVAELREALARAVAERDAAEAIRTAEVAAKVEVIEELRAMLADLRRPWWRRWRG